MKCLPGILGEGGEIWSHPNIPLDDGEKPTCVQHQTYCWWFRNPFNHKKILVNHGIKLPTSTGLAGFLVASLHSRGYFCHRFPPQKLGPKRRRWWRHASFRVFWRMRKPQRPLKLSKGVTTTLSCKCDRMLNLQQPEFSLIFKVLSCFVKVILVNYYLIIKFINRAHVFVDMLGVLWGEPLLFLTEDIFILGSVLVVTLKAAFAEDRSMTNSEIRRGFAVSIT